MKLRLEACEAAAKLRHQRALERYLELERVESKAAAWSRKSGEMYRQLGQLEEGIAAFMRAADKYIQSGEPIKASALCHAILRLDPENEQAVQRLARLRVFRSRVASA